MKIKKLKFIYIFILFFILSYSLYFDTLHHEFMMDDWALLFVKEKIPDLSHIINIFNTNDRTVIYYRPLTSMLECILVSTFGHNPIYYHLFNILLFSIHTTLILSILLELLGNISLSVIISILYAIHPINSGMINYITGHEILLFAILLDTSTLLFIRYLKQPLKSNILLLSVLFYGLSLFVYEISITLPLYLFLISLYIQRLSLTSTLKKILPYLIITGLYVAFRLCIVKQTTTVINGMFIYLKLNHIDTYVYFNTVAKLILWYIKQLLIPTDIILIQKMQPECSGFYLYFILFIFFLITSIFLFRNYKNISIKFLAFFWFAFGFIAPICICLVYPKNGLTIEPHWFFFSSIGFFILCGLFIDHFLSIYKNTFSKVLIFILLLSWVSTTKTYNQIWKTQKKYCLYWLSVTPNFHFPNYWLADSLLKEQNLEQAKYFFKKSLIGGFVDFPVYANLGDIEVRLGNYNQAQKYYRLALRLSPKDEQIQEVLQKTNTLVKNTQPNLYN